MKFKKSLITLLMISVLFLSTGCVKFNAEMNIKKDKSMDFSIVYALDTSLFGEDAFDLSEEDKKNIEDQGYKIEEYSEDGMKGVILTRNVSNIDDISSTDDVDYDLTAIMQNNNNGKNLFKVTKGFFKNSYKVKLAFNASNNSLKDEEEVEDNDLMSDEEDSYIDSTGEYDSYYSDSYSQMIESMTSKMDLKFSAIVPYEVKSHNANINDSNKKLTWELDNNKNSTIEFEFELYNYNNIYLCVGIGLIVIIGGVVLVYMIVKKKDGSVEEA